MLIHVYMIELHMEGKYGIKTKLLYFYQHSIEVEKSTYKRHIHLNVYKYVSACVGNIRMYVYHIYLYSLNQKIKLTNIAHVRLTKDVRTILT